MSAPPELESGPKSPDSGRIRLSACIIAMDEERDLPDCLASVAFCDEVIVVDSGSTDATVALAEAAGARVVASAWRGFAAQRNVALDHARGDWVIEVDADERVSPELRASVEAFVAADPPGTDLAGLPLRELLVGRALGPSAQWPKYRHRLLRRSAHRHDEARTVHEGLVPHGPVAPMDGDLVHLLATTWGQAFRDTWAYARLEAGQLTAPRTPRAVLLGAVVRPHVKLVYRLTVAGGWRDGPHGAAKIALECLGDALVWYRHALRLHGAVRGHSGVASTAHYGAWRTRVGGARLLGIAGDADAARDATAWLTHAAEAGADVALLTPEPAGAGFRTRRWSGRGPVGLSRALLAEEQLRPLDAVVPFGGRARRALRLAAGAPRGEVVLDPSACTPADGTARALATRPDLGDTGA